MYVIQAPIDHYNTLRLRSNLTRNHQLLTRGPKRPPFPARDPKSVPTALSLPVPARTHSQIVIPICRLHEKCPHSGTFSCVYFREFDVVLCGLPGASYSINGCLPLGFTSFLIFFPIFSHISSHISSHILSHILFSPSSHLHVQSLPFLKQDLLFSFPL